MFRAKRIILVIGLLIIAGVALSLFIRFSPNKSTLKVTQVHNIILYGYDREASLSWRVRADKGELQEEEGDLFNVEVAFYSKEEEELEVSAETLAFETTKMTLSGQVVATHRNGYTLCAQTLTWTEPSDELVGNNINLSSDTLTLNAIEFLYELKNRQALLDGDIRAQLLSTSPNEDEEPSLFQDQDRIELGTLEAERALLTDQGITTYGNVRVALHPRFFGEQYGS
jgi:hypothetical protein